MSKMYNAFGELISVDEIENFSETIKDEGKNKKNEENKEEKEESRVTFFLNRLSEFRKNLEEGKISKEEAEKRIKSLKEISRDKEAPMVIKKAISNFLRETRRKRNGLRLDGNLELSGIMKSKGYYLTDGTPIKEIIREKNKLAVPIDKEGNISLKKDVKVKGLFNVNNYKDYNLSLGEGGDQINSRIGKNGSAGLYLNHRSKGNVGLASGGGNVGVGTTKPISKLDVVNEKRTGKVPNNKPALYVTSSSQPGNPNGKAIAEFRHSNQTQGIGFGYNTIYATGNNSSQDLNIKPKGNGVVTVHSKRGITHKGHGKTSSFGSLNSGWCHLITNAPQFYMNKSLQINGNISSYSNKPLKTNRGIDSSDRIVVRKSGRTTTYGSLNSWWSHFITNAPQFYMNKSLQVNGAISSYHNKPINANRGVNAPHYSRIGGDWLRINPEGNSAGRVAVYGGFSINDKRRGMGGLGVGYWSLVLGP